MIIFMFIFCTIMFFVANYYIGNKIKKVTYLKKGDVDNKRFWWIYWIATILLILSSQIGRVIGVETILGKILLYIGTNYVGLFMYSVFIFFGIDVVIILLRKITKKEYNTDFILGKKVVIVFIIAFIFGTIGIINDRNQIVTEYDIAVKNKENNLKVIFISDMHIGVNINYKEVDELVKKVNDLNGDIVLLGGDIVDEGSSKELIEYACKAFNKFQSTYGTFYVLGNHEYVSRNAEKMEEYLSDTNIRFLKDDSILVDDKFYIVGRDDGINEERETLKNLTKDLNKEKPIIVLDHEPGSINESAEEKIDLQLSGHTHKGQVFPGSFITNLVYEIDYGILNKEDTNIIVSSGYGSWGIPMRVGTKGEIVIVNFKY